MSHALRPAVDSSCAHHWNLHPRTTYLNHGSFGPAPAPVLEAQRALQRRMQENPMDYFVRELPKQLLAAREALGRFIGADSRDLAFCDNATTGMNIVANSLRLAPGDEILCNNHEYGAVLRIWERACRAAGARVVVVDLPPPFHTPREIVERLTAAMNSRTRLVVVSHVTSPTAIVFPVEEICAAARERGIAVCIDGPHAVAMRPLEIRTLGCDFYVASCHKWLAAPFGAGFIYVDRRHQQQLQVPVLSWGRPHPGNAAAWQDEFDWQGTRDYSPWLAIPTAIEFLHEFGCEKFRQQTHELARYGRQRLLELADRPLLTPDNIQWYGSMVAVPLPDGPAEPLQQALCQQFGIEVPIVSFGAARYVRLSCHLYTTCEQIDQLCNALRALLARRQ